MGHTHNPKVSRKKSNEKRTYNKGEPVKVKEPEKFKKKKDKKEY